MGIGDMDRRMLMRNLQVRAEKLAKEVRALPLAEKLRLAADFVEADQPKHALAVARFAVAELEATKKVRP